MPWQGVQAVRLHLVAAGRRAPRRSMKIARSSFGEYWTPKKGCVVVQFHDVAGAVPLVDQIAASAASGAVVW